MLEDNDKLNVQMKIQQYDRVRYENNPLAEVICQVRFPYESSLADSLPDKLSTDLHALGYTQRSEEQVFSISIAIPPIPASSTDSVRAPTGKIFHLSEESGIFKVSICSDYLALSCAKYLSWDDFKPKFIQAYDVLRKLVPDITPLRLGLRYKDVIVRESIGLEGVQWHELISPFLLGPLGLHAFNDDDLDIEESVPTSVMQSTIRLEDCELLLQSALLRSADGDKTAFLIDSDFYVENSSPEVMNDDTQLHLTLTKLHHSAGSLFRRGITEKLHAALSPKQI